MKKISTVVFDFNGTILDDLDICFQILNQMLINHHHKPITLNRYLDIFTFPIKKYYVAAGFDFSIDDFNQLADEFINLYQDASLSCPLTPGFIDAISFLKKHQLKLIILSASEQGRLNQQVDHLKINQYFDVVLGTENILAHGKEQRLKDYLSSNHLIAQETLFIGDTLHDYEVAKSIGAEILLVSSGHQSKKVLSSADVPVIETLKDFITYFSATYTI